MAKDEAIGEPIEGRAGVARVEAFSDGVLAIIVTIMVLELHAPDEAGLSALFHLWKTFFAYVLSYNYIAIYWVNHHRLFSHARVVTNSLLWSNIVLLFTLSLIPFSTAYLGKHLGDPLASGLYALSLLAPGLAFLWLETAIKCSGSQSLPSLAYYRATTRKGFAASLVYALAIPISLVSPYIGVTLAGLVGLFWMLPYGRLDRLFSWGDN
jgi:uncharacterized membrane protein